MPVYFESRKNKRSTNQDYHLFMEYRINHEAMIRIFLVADGMGGLACGELASSLAGEKWLLKLQKFTMSKEFLGRSLNEQIENLKRFSYQAVEEINEEVYRELSDRGITGGTTLTTGILYWDTLILANCGDSPAYLYQKKGNSFVSLSREQNAAEELLKEGKVTKDSPEYRRHKHLLTDYIGKYRRAEPHVTLVPFCAGDMLLIGSDGAFGNLQENQIKNIVKEKEHAPEQIVRDILSASEQLGEEDNQTLIVYMEEPKENIIEKKKGKWSLFQKRQAVK